MNLKGIGAAWFRREDWERWRELDPDLRPDFDDWLKRMEAAFAKYQAAGLPIVKVVIDLDTFIAWADANGTGYASDARTVYAGMRAHEMDSSGDRH